MYGMIWSQKYGIFTYFPFWYQLLGVVISGVRESTIFPDILMTFIIDTYRMGFAECNGSKSTLLEVHANEVYFLFNTTHMDLYICTSKLCNQII